MVAAAAVLLLAGTTPVQAAPYSDAVPASTFTLPDIGGELHLSALPSNRPYPPLHRPVQICRDGLV